LQIAYNAIYQASCDYQREPLGVVPLAKSLGMGVTTMRTATSGVLQKLLRTEFPDIDLKRVTRLAINFVLSTPEIDSAIVGMKTPDEVTEMSRWPMMWQNESTAQDSTTAWMAFRCLKDKTP